MATPVVLTTGARPIVPVESGGVPMTPVDTLGEPVTVVDTLGEPVVLINEDGTPAYLAYSAKTYLGGVAPYHWLDFINNRALYAGVDVGNVTQATGYSFTRASQGYYQNADGTLTKFASGALRRGDRGVLIEGSRTNLVLWSADFSNVAWAYTTATPTHGVADPAGGTTATTLTATSANGQILQAIGGSLGIGTTYSATLWVRRRTGSGAVSLFNPNAGGITSISPTSSWQRFSVIGAGAAATNFVGIRLATSGDAVDIAFSQLEAAAFPSSYIPTTTAAATRAADVLTYTAGVSYPTTIWCQFQRGVDTGGSEVLARLAADNNNLVDLGINGSDLAELQMVAGGVSQGFPAVAGAVGIGATTRIAGRFDTNSMQLARNGTLGTEDTSATLPTAPTLLYIGGGNATRYSFSYIEKIAIIQGAKINSELQGMTT